MVISKPTTISAKRRNPQTDEQGRRLTLAPTSLAQYLSLDSCDRFLRLYLYKGQTAALDKRLRDRGLRLALQPFSPLMAELGDRIETTVIAALRAQGHTVIDLGGADFEETLAALQKVGEQPLYLYQAHLEGHLGQWRFEGRADLVRLRYDSSGKLDILVADIKASRKDKVNHRLQVAIYVRLVQTAIAQLGLAAVFSGTVIRRNADGILQNPDTAVPFELSPYFVALEQLAEGPDSALARVDATPLENLHYYLDQKCDGCLFNPLCMVDSTARQDVALIPFLESADKRALTTHNIRTVGQLAGLKSLPVAPPKTEDEAAAPIDRSLHIVPGQEATVAALSQEWPLGPKLDRLIQRAARVWHRLEPANQAILSRSYFLDAAHSILPDDKTYPDLVKIFLDVQTDYLEDKVWLAGARVVGPKGSRSITKITPGPPDAETERALLVGWVTEIFAAVLEVCADQTAAPLHLYLYNRHDQKALLEALRRHLDVFAQVPALYEMLTETPALTQAAVSFVYDEVKERLNLPSTGHTLQAVATQRGFKWNDGDDLRYFRLFERGMFDYLWRQEDGQWIESALRCYSTIPLEYAYAAWGKFRAEDFKPEKRHEVWPYLQVNIEQLQKFQTKRLEALAHIEASLLFKNAYIQKEPINLLALGTHPPHSLPFRQVLEEFLYIEHYANLQEHLQLFGQSFARRVQQGRALRVRCVSVEDKLDATNRKSTFASFEADFSQTNLEPALAMQLNKIKSGDFVVLNKLEADGRGWQIVRGRIGVIQAMEGLSLSLKLTDMTFGKSKNAPVDTDKKISFRYSHDNRLRPMVDEFYLIDEMVDDLNGDKLLEACRHADFNPFYHLLANYVAPTKQATKAEAANPVAAWAADFGELVARLEGQNAPTLRQQEVISGHLTEPIFLVQGPPGTGKSHTLGWAVLARIFARLKENGTLRVAVSCQTHNAVNIVLQSIASKLRRLDGTEVAGLLAKLRIFKIGEDENEGNTAVGVEVLDTWQQRFQLKQILDSQAVVIGGTPGGLFRLMKERTKNIPGADAMWETKPFDLVILDEASQMNLPQALLASSWLREDGQLIVVGDHRQMAPILAHAWADEDRLSTVQNHPYRSVFQYLVDQNFPRVALDESFRLHRVQAEFLRATIYQQDNIRFHSRREQLLAVLNQDISPYLRAVLNPDYPIIVVEHDEQGSQQANPTEADLITPIIELCQAGLGLEGIKGIGVVVPHRAQKALLRQRFPSLAQVAAIDTVERFQGDEREVIIVSATASDPAYILAEAEFLLSPNRLNVALSRSQQKLIVVASRAVFKFLSANLEIFDQATLWKRLLSDYTSENLWSGVEAGTGVRVWGCKT